jgi:hypothetical protein
MHGAAPGARRVGRRRVGVESCAASGSGPTARGGVRTLRGSRMVTRGVGRVAP